MKLGNGQFGPAFAGDRKRNNEGVAAVQFYTTNMRFTMDARVLTGNFYYPSILVINQLKLVLQKGSGMYVLCRNV